MSAVLSMNRGDDAPHIAQQLEHSEHGIRANTLLQVRIQECRAETVVNQAHDFFDSKAKIALQQVVFACA